MRSLFVLCLLGCGAPAENKPKTGKHVRVEYRAATTLNQSGLQDRQDCVRAVGETHIHPSWLNYRIVYMTVEEDGLWVIEFDDVPTGLQRVRISDANVCRDNATGAVTKKAIRVNDVLLTKATETPGDEGFPEPGFSMLVNEDGSVSP